MIVHSKLFILFIYLFIYVLFCNFCVFLVFFWLLFLVIVLVVKGLYRVHKQMCLVLVQPTMPDAFLSIVYEDFGFHSQL